MSKNFAKKILQKINCNKSRQKSKEPQATKVTPETSWNFKEPPLINFSDNGTILASRIFGAPLVKTNLLDCNKYKLLFEFNILYRMIKLIIELGIDFENQILVIFDPTYSSHRNF